MRTVLSVFATAGLFAVSSIAAHAATTAVSNMNVTITIEPTCSISSVTDVAFGTVLSTATGTTASGQIAVNCTLGTTYAINLGQGNNYNAAQSTRRMSASVGGTTYYVPYGLYSDSAYSTAWGSSSDTNGWSVNGSKNGAGADQTYTVYGKVPSANFPAGTYNDTVAVTVTY